MSVKCQKQTSIPNQDSYRDLTGAGGTACVPVALAEAESGTTGMSASPFARLLKQASRRQELLDSLEFHSPMFARRWRLTSQNGESTARWNDPREARGARRKRDLEN